jgi:hypothetical protein
MAAPKGNKFAKGNKGGGAPTAYRPHYATQATKACQAGFTDRELGILFGVSEATINNWKLMHEDFARALKAAKEPANDRVERSLYQLAIGYEYDSEKVFCNQDGQVTRVPIRVHVQPSATACIFWLKNRRKDLWRERPEVEQTLGFDPNQSIEELRDELLQDMADAGLVKLLPAPQPPEPAAVPPAGVANRKPDKAKH